MSVISLFFRFTSVTSVSRSHNIAAPHKPNRKKLLKPGKKPLQSYGRIFPAKWPQQKRERFQVNSSPVRRTHKNPLRTHNNFPCWGPAKDCLYLIWGFNTSVSQYLIWHVSGFNANEICIILGRKFFEEWVWENKQTSVTPISPPHNNIAASRAVKLNQNRILFRYRIECFGSNQSNCTQIEANNFFRFSIWFDSIWFWQKPEQ